MASTTAANWLRAMSGAIIGAGLGYLAFNFMANNGLYAMVLPGALVGLVAGRVSGAYSNAIGAACAVIGTLTSVLIEWNFAPFVADDSLSYFISRVHRISPVHLIMIAIGVAFAFWFGRGRERFNTQD